MSCQHSECCLEPDLMKPLCTSDALCNEHCHTCITVTFMNYLSEQKDQGSDETNQTCHQLLCGLYKVPEHRRGCGEDKPKGS